MNYEYELNFLIDVLKKCRISTAFFSPSDALEQVIDSWLGAIIGVCPNSNNTIQKTLGKIENFTQYKFTNELNLKYIIIKLPKKEAQNLLFIGPYISAPFSSKEILEIGESLNLSAGTQRLLQEYYTSVPVVSQNDKLFYFVDTFCERVWNLASFNIVEINKDNTFNMSSQNSMHEGEDVNELLANMERVEVRYAYENEIINAVKFGQKHKERVLTSAFSEDMLEKRVADPLRNAKNYCIIMNTLLRKAAEEGGVHPLYIDRTSSTFAIKIEQITDIKDISNIMRDIFLAYCGLVCKHSTKQYSQIVQKTILLIDSDVSAELSLNILAKKQGISSGYLATVFKKETGKTISEYIRDKRIKKAVYLLNNTSLQIQTIAMHCGIMDIQYFSKVFKRQIGKTPKEYRENNRK